jgi:hypothetical protein
MLTEIQNIPMDKSFNFLDFSLFFIGIRKPHLTAEFDVSGHKFQMAQGAAKIC